MQIDDLGLIEYVTVQKATLLGLPLFERALSPLAGKHQEVFRDDVPAGSVPPLEAKGPGERPTGLVRVRRGDYVYRVAVRWQRSLLVGTILTRDRYQCLYEMDIAWRVSNPLQCAYMYHQGEHPERDCVARLKITLQKHASGIEHDQLGMHQFPFEQWAAALRELYGLTAVCSRLFFRFDDQKTQEDKIAQTARLREYTLEEESRVTRLEEDREREKDRRQRQFDRDEKQKQSEFAREERLRYHINEARITLLNQSVTELVQINKERLRDAADYNGSFKTVLEDSLRLLQAFHQSPRTEREIVDEARQTDLPLLHIGALDPQADSLNAAVSPISDDQSD
ncbi:MAG TPA: hypothetical protein VGF67_16210 [Ktedonobacteraceae bacterium]|jgi:hypothetical protein